MKKDIHVDPVIEAIKVLKYFNSLDLKDCILYKNGVPLNITRELLDRWRFVGLSNKCFIELEPWENVDAESGEVILDWQEPPSGT